TLASSFAFASDVGAGAEGEVATVEADQFGDSQTGLDGQDEHGSVAAAFPAGLVGGVDQRGGLFCGEVADRGPLDAFGWDGQDSLDEMGVFGVAQGGVAEQGADGGEAQVAGA